MYIYPQYPSANRCMEHLEFLGSTFGAETRFPTASRSLRRWRAFWTNHCCISIWISMSWTLQSFLMCSLARQPLDHESTNCLSLKKPWMMKILKFAGQTCHQFGMAPWQAEERSIARSGSWIPVLKRTRQNFRKKTRFLRFLHFPWNAVYL